MGGLFENLIKIGDFLGLRRKKFYKHKIIFLSESLKVAYIDLPQLEFGRQIKVFSTKGLDQIKAVSNVISRE